METPQTGDASQYPWTPEEEARYHQRWLERREPESEDEQLYRVAIIGPGTPWPSGAVPDESTLPLRTAVDVIELASGYPMRLTREGAFDQEGRCTFFLDWAVDGKKRGQIFRAVPAERVRLRRPGDPNPELTIQTRLVRDEPPHVTASRVQAGCGGKAAHATRANAEVAAKNTTSRTAPYRCGFCGLWHLEGKGSKSPGKTRKRRGR